MNTAECHYNASLGYTDHCHRGYGTLAIHQNNAKQDFSSCRIIGPWLNRPSNKITAVFTAPNWTELTCTKLTQLHDALLVTRVSVTKLMGCRAAVGLQFTNCSSQTSVKLFPFYHFFPVDVMLVRVLAMTLCLCLYVVNCFFARKLLSTYSTLCCKEIQVSTKMRVLLSGTLSKTPKILLRHIDRRSVLST